MAQIRLHPYQTQRLGDDPVVALGCHITRSHIGRREQRGQRLARGNHQHLTKGDQNHREDQQWHRRRKSITPKADCLCWCCIRFQLRVERVIDQTPAFHGFEIILADMS
jgi:hypothetical protein